MEAQNVAILGASKNEDRYSYKVRQALKENGHNTFLVHPLLDEIENEKVYHSLAEIKDHIDTLTIYVNPGTSSLLKDQITELKPKRVIFNPGSENIELQNYLREKGIPFLNSCTLVMVLTDQF